MKKQNLNDPTPIRLDSELLEKIEIASSELKMSKQETIRLSIKVGLEKLRRIKYDLAGAVIDAAEQAEKTHVLPLAAEDATHYKTGNGQSAQNKKIA
jgi:hypothetical protein